MKAERQDVHKIKAELRHVRWGMFLLILIGVCNLFAKTEFVASDTIRDTTTAVNSQDGSTSLENDDNEDNITYNKEKDERQWLLSRNATTGLQSHVVNYKLQSSKFIQILSDCITDEYCHIHYLHTGKTGGTTVEFYFSKLLGLGHIKSCCGDYVKRQFRTPKGAKGKCLTEFISVQLKARDFMNGPIKTCLDVYANENDTSNSTHKHHIVALATFREPYARTISSIHQTCNKNVRRRGKEVVAMCKRCDYNRDQKNWNRLFIDKTNFGYASIYNDLILGTADLGIPVLTVDSLDISPFFEGLKTSLPSEYASKLKERGIRNKETLHVCNFGFPPSAMMKNLASSLEVYRNLTLGW